MSGGPADCATVGGQRVCVTCLRHCVRPSCGSFLLSDSDIELKELQITSNGLSEDLDRRFLTSSLCESNGIHLNAYQLFIRCMSTMCSMYPVFIVPDLKLIQPVLDPCFSRYETTRAQPVLERGEEPFNLRIHLPNAHLETNMHNTLSAACIRKLHTKQ